MANSASAAAREVKILAENEADMTVEIEAKLSAEPAEQVTVK